MVIYRTNTGRAQAASTSDERLASVQRHQSPVPHAPPLSVVTEALPIRDAPGDIIYGAKAIALFIFGTDDNRTRRRVFNLWSHYRDRKEDAGFFKLKGAVCLSKSQWQRFRAP